MASEKAVTVGDVSKAQSVLLTPEELSMLIGGLQSVIISQARALAKNTDPEVGKAMAQRNARHRLLEARLSGLVVYSGLGGS